VSASEKGISKAALVAIVAAAVLFGFIIYSTMNLKKVECEVCVDFEGRKKCLTVRGEDEAQAMQTAKENACSFVTNGRTEGFRCSQTPPASVKCKHL